MKKTNDAVKIIDKLTATDPKVEASINAVVAQLIYEARTKRQIPEDSW